MIKKPLLVTLADKNYLEKAKQVFSGAYFNGGWKGDYLLLAHDVPDEYLKWFRQRGILIRHCSPIFKKIIADTPASYISRLYIFTEEFKKWSHVIYVDGDIIIRASLDHLLNISGFASVEDVYKTKLKGEVKLNDSSLKSRNLFLNFETNYNLDTKTFCAGFFVVNTSIIDKTTFNNIISVIKKYHPIATNADQFALNVYFYKKWLPLPPVYDFYVTKTNQWKITYQNITAVILHFIGKNKPWQENNYFYLEWLKNYSMAEKIDLKNIPVGIKLSKFKIFYISLKLNIREWYINNFSKYLHSDIPSKIYFRILLLTENNWPRLFSILKSIKYRIKQFMNSTRIFFPSYEEELQEYKPYLSGKILNVGSGNRDIKKMFNGNVTNLDLEKTRGLYDVDIYASAEKIPVKNNSYDSVICNAVLEAVKDPDKAVKEFYRILKKNGYLYLCIPFMQPIHKGPEDYWRFTKDGLILLIEKNGFKIIKAEPNHTYARTLAWILHEWMITKKSFIYFPMKLFLRLSLLLYVRYSKVQIESVASSFRILARK